MNKILLCTISYATLFGAAKEAAAPPASSSELQVICNASPSIKLLESEHTDEWQLALHSIHNNDIELFQNRSIKDLVNKVGATIASSKNVNTFFTLLEVAIRYKKAKQFIQTLCDEGASQTASYEIYYPEHIDDVTISVGTQRHAPIYYAIMFEHVDAFEILYPASCTILLPVPCAEDDAPSSTDKKSITTQEMTIEKFLERLITEKESNVPPKNTETLKTMLNFVHSQASSCVIS